MKLLTPVLLLVWTAAWPLACLDVELQDEVLVWSTDTSSGPESPAQDGSTDGVGSSDSGAPQPDPQDTSPPGVSPVSCVSTERVLAQACLAMGPASLSLRFASDEPATLSLEDAGPQLELRLLSGDWAIEHHAIAVIRAHPRPALLALLVSDATGNISRLEVPVELPDLPGVAITEVLADPLGAEPDQEFVEVANLTEAELDLSGFMVDDNADRNGDLLPPGCVLPASGVALIVGPDFDPGTAAGATLFVLAGSIGSAGLRNDPPESVELYDPTGTLVSVYPGLPQSPGEGCSAVRPLAWIPDRVPGVFVADPGGSSSPGSVAR